MAAQSASAKKAHNDYTVGWVCALPKEQTAAMAMLDERHPDLPSPQNDTNSYTLGSIGKHNIVIACLPKGKVGTSSAATVATQMARTFPSVRFGLMVGIGGGIPPAVRLGDVVISTPVGQYQGVVQWDFGKAEEGGFKRTGGLNSPPSLLLTALTTMESRTAIDGSKIPQYLKEMEEKYPRLVSKYTRSALFRSPYFAPDITGGTKGPISGDSNIGSQRESDDLCVHYGLIASGNQVIKEAEVRNSSNERLGGHVLCVEMEAAGLMNDFPCIVIRGICDYADSQKNKDWQEHAAAAAAACAKELLEYVQPSDVDRERPVKDILDKSQPT